jgi:hypothetical protein
MVRAGNRRQNSNYWKRPLTFSLLYSANSLAIDPDCSWMHWAEQRWSNGEIRVPGDDVIYAAPLLIVHYIEEHGYLPPAEFLKALAAR